MQLERCPGLVEVVYTATGHWKGPFWVDVCLQEERLGGQLQSYNKTVL